MKSSIVAVLTMVIGLAVPMAASANSYSEVLLGAGTTQLPNGQYAIVVLPADDGFASTGVLASSSYDFVGGYSHYWSLGAPAWLGLGFTLTIPLSFDQNSANQGVFASPTILALDGSLRFDITPDVSITARFSASASAVYCIAEETEFFGTGYSISLGPTLYFNKNIGISGLIGYTTFYALNAALGGLVDQFYSNDGWFATVCLAFKF